MATNSNPLVATGWITVTAKRTEWGKRQDGTFPVGTVRMTSLRASKPSIGPDEEAVEVTIEFPADYFDESSPKVHVVVPQTQQHSPLPVTATVIKGKAPSAAAQIVHGSTAP